MRKSKSSNIWKIMGVYTSAIIGAGFASGQELLQFFAGYGIWGITGLVVAGLLFAFTGWAVLEVSLREQITDGTALLKYALGERLGLIVEISAVFFMFVLYSTMMAATGASLNQYIGLNFTVGVVIGSALAFAALLFDMKGLIAVNSRIAPFLVIGGLLIGFMTFMDQTTPAFARRENLYWLFAAITYAAYNIVTCVPVLASMSVMLKKRKEAIICGVLSGGVMTLLGLFMLYPLYINYANIRYSEIPLLRISANFGYVFEFFYVLIIIGAIYTTAVSNGFALIQWLNKRIGVKPIYAKMILAFSGLLCAHIGFSMFVSRVYPLFAMVGLIQIAGIFSVWLKKSPRAAARHSERRGSVGV